MILSPEKVIIDSLDNGVIIRALIQRWTEMLAWNFRNIFRRTTMKTWNEEILVDGLHLDVNGNALLGEGMMDCIKTSSADRTGDKVFPKNEAPSLFTSAILWYKVYWFALIRNHPISMDLSQGIFSLIYTTSSFRCVKIIPKGIIAPLYWYKIAFLFQFW